MAEEAAKVKGIERIIMIENGSYDKASGLLAHVRVDFRADNRLGSS